MADRRMSFVCQGKTKAVKKRRPKLRRTQFFLFIEKAAQSLLIATHYFTATIDKIKL